MIVVIADDLSGAAELAGVARGFGLGAEVHTRFDPSATADVVCVDTDSRLLPTERATEVVTCECERIQSARPEWVYKKTDSVLRGNVLAEIETIRAAFGKSRCLFVPANPGKGRVIRDGRYLINDVPLPETEFRNDPEFPARAADVRGLLATRTTTAAPPLPEIPDVTSPADLHRLARRVDETTLAAGAAEFFDALLEARGHRRGPVSNRSNNSTTGASLFVCGSATGWNSGRRRHCEARGLPVLELPDELFAKPARVGAVARWSEEVAGTLAAGGTVMMAIGAGRSKVSSAALLARFAAAVSLVLKEASPARLLLEGGATASAVMRAMGWSRLRVRESLAFGLATMEVIGPPAPLLIIKPGSYPWPREIWAAPAK